MSSYVVLVICDCGVQWGATIVIDRFNFGIRWKVTSFFRASCRTLLSLWGGRVAEIEIENRLCSLHVTTRSYTPTNQLASHHHWPTASRQNKRNLIFTGIRPVTLRMSSAMKRKAAVRRPPAAIYINNCTNGECKCNHQHVHYEDERRVSRDNW